MESMHPPETFHHRFFLSWTAYVKPILLFSIILVSAIAVYVNLHQLGGVGLAGVAIILFTYHMLWTRSVVLYIDDHGVWIFRGILPWSKGTHGVKWRDLEDAAYFPGFLNWVFRSYTIRVGHRFTKASEIIVPHIHRGNLAVEHINRIHTQKIAGHGMD